MFGYVFIELLEVPRSQHIIEADRWKPLPTRGKIIGVGEGVDILDVGDEIIFKPGAEAELYFHGMTLHVVHESDVLATLTRESAHDAAQRHSA